MYRYRCSLPGLAGFTGQRWQNHEHALSRAEAVESTERADACTRNLERTENRNRERKKQRKQRTKKTENEKQRTICSGEGGIRTLGTVPGTHDFQSCTFDHSVTPPSRFRGPDACEGPLESTEETELRKQKEQANQNLGGEYGI